MTDRESGVGVETKVVLEPFSDLKHSDLVEGIQDLRGFTVLSSEGNEIGSVEELYVDPRHHQPSMASLKIGGFLGIGAKHILVPVNQLEILEDQRVRVMTRDEILAEAPEMVDQNAPDFNVFTEFWMTRHPALE